MKSELVSKYSIKPKYPYLGILKNKKSHIILFSGRNSATGMAIMGLGTVVWANENSIYKNNIGYSGHWNEAEFEPYEGEVKLSNE